MTRLISSWSETPGLDFDSISVVRNNGPFVGCRYIARALGRQIASTISFSGPSEWSCARAGAATPGERKHAAGVNAFLQASPSLLTPSPSFLGGVHVPQINIHPPRYDPYGRDDKRLRTRGRRYDGEYSQFPFVSQRSDSGWQDVLGRWRGCLFG